MAKIAKRRDRWVIDFYDTTGKRRWKTMPEGSKKKDANNKLREIKGQIARGIYFPDKRIPTFKKFSADWLEYKRPNVRSTTLEMYEGFLKNHLCGFDLKSINRISIADVERFISGIRNAGMNITTLRKIIICLNQIFKYAQHHGCIGLNPVAIVERPRKQDSDEEIEISVLGPEQINRFLDKENDQEYRTLFMFAIMSGARQGEILGLRWSDIKWDDNQVHIQRTFNHGAIRPPKTKKSNR